MSNLQQLISRQVGKWNLERELHKSYLTEGIQASRPSHAKPIVTVSRQRGALGCSLAKALADALGYGFVDKAIVEAIAQDKGVRGDMVELLDEHDRSELELWVRGLLMDRVFDYDDYIHELGKILKTVALQGGVVILGRGANFILHNTHAFHVRVVADTGYRLRNIMNEKGSSEEEAKRTLEKVDRERAHLVKRYFLRDIEDPTAYDLVLNMNALTVEMAVKIILSAMRAKGWPLELTGGDKRMRNAG